MQRLLLKRRAGLDLESEESADNFLNGIQSLEVALVHDTNHGSFRFTPRGIALRVASNFE